MRIACGFALALWLSSSAAGVARQRDPAGSANASGQVSSAPAAAAKTVSSEPATRLGPAAVQKASASAADRASDKKTDTVAPTGTVGSTRKRRKRVMPAPEGAPRKIIVREGGTQEPGAQIAPDINPAESARQRQEAEQSLGSTDVQLKQLTGRPLNPQQQESVAQIRNYIQGAHSALKEGDVRRAGTLAEKAHLLSDDLVKH
jgi:hypothetical protein